MTELPSLGLDPDVIRRGLTTTEGGPGRVAVLRRRVRQKALYLASRALMRLLPALERAAASRRRTCVICGWSGVEFRPFVGAGWMQRDARCPGCDAFQRQRLLALALREEGRTGRTLWVAPEPCLQALIQGAGDGIVTCDLTMPDVDIRADAEALPVRDGSIACVVISDVLEHVVDDRRALKEICRVLAHDGEAIIHVPILGTETVEYGFANEAEWGHRRSYGPDLSLRFVDASLELRAFRADQLPPRLRRRHGLLEWDSVLIATPTPA